MHVSALIATLLRSGTSVRFRAAGSSMGVAIRSGQVVEVEPVKVGQLWRGDIVLYEREAAVIAHRLLGMVDVPGSGVHLIVRGDSLAHCDRPVAAAAVLGRVTRVRRDLSALVSSFGRAVRATSAALR
jgi:hypothetical protein